MEGLLGLQSSIRDRQSAMDDLAIMDRFSQQVEQDRQMEAQADQQQQTMYEMMYAQADQYLGKDRDRINEKIKRSQRHLEGVLGEFGGSKKMFMQNGGFAVMNNLKNDIIRSEEAIRYEENKKNFLKILEAKEKGMGHLLNPNDLKSLEDYERSQNGSAITYSGLMNDIEIPPSDLFEWGTQIPIEDIINHGSNEIKLRLNYKQMYPDRKDPDRAELIRFAIQQGYGGRGSNMQIAKMRMQQENERRQMAQAKDPDEPKRSYINELHNSFSQMPHIKVSELAQYDGHYIEHLKSTDKHAANIYGDKNNLIGRHHSLWHAEGVNWKGLPGQGTAIHGWERVLNKKYGLASSNKILEMNNEELAKRIFRGAEIENGRLKDWIPDNDVYDTKGNKVHRKGVGLKENKHKGDYEMLGAYTAFKVKPASAPDGVLLVNSYKDNGKINTEHTKRMHDAMGEEFMEPTTVFALRDKNGNLFYKEFDIKSSQSRNVLQNALGADDDITDTVSMEKQSAKEIGHAKQLSVKEQEQHRAAYKVVNEGAFKVNNSFKEEASQYWKPGSGGSSNRDSLMKAFYMALDHERTGGHHPKTTNDLINNNYFTQLTTLGGINDDLKNYHIQTPQEMLNKWYQNMQYGETEGSLVWQGNENLYNKWSQIYKLITEGV